jgi:hypothetical protein
MKRLLIFSFGLLPFIIDPAIAQVRALGLQEIVQSAATSFVGTVTALRYGYDNDHDIVTFTTFRVDETVIGRPASVVTIKQLGGVMDGLDTRVEHIRYFTKGERVLVSIYPNSGLGFSNPVGLDQGVWPVTKNGMVLNVTHNQLDGLSAILPDYGINSAAPAQSAPQAINKKNFVSLMRALSSRSATVQRGGQER